MTRCEITVTNGEYVGSYQFDNLPRAEETFVLTDGRHFRVAHVEHALNDSGTGTFVHRLTVWKIHGL